MTTLFSIEINEVNFDAVRHYAALGKLPAFDRLMQSHGVAETHSEQRYEELEPWIQWVSAHTGLPLGAHGVFRLGDIVDQDIPQIWDILESAGITVGAISPMNAKNRLTRAAFFVPDPWTRTAVTGSPLLVRLHEAIAQIVGDNAQGRITPRSAVTLATALVRYARPANYGHYASLLAGLPGRSWHKPMILDLLLTDLFIALCRKHKPDFASLFVNAAAHIQHHYLFNSPAYAGRGSNPEWYLPPGCDPLLDVYRLYDRLIAQIRAAFPETRLIIATGLHQDPHPDVTYYWRLKDHGRFLNALGIAFQSIEPLMSRDFFVRCRTAQEAMQAEAQLASIRDDKGVALFDVDNRGDSLFVMLTYPFEITDQTVYIFNAREYRGLKDEVAFVAIKNGQHNGVGYMIDTAETPATVPAQLDLCSLPHRIASAFGLTFPIPGAGVGDLNDAAPRMRAAGR